MEKTKDIFAIIFRDYWSYNKQKAKIKEHEDRDRLAMRVELLQEVLNSTVRNQYFSPEVFFKVGKVSSIYNEVDWILQNLPRKLVNYIPVSLLADIVGRRYSFYNKKLELRRENDYNEETIPVVKFLIEKYVPGNIINEILTSVPEAFDLNCIFEDDFLS